MLWFPRKLNSICLAFISLVPPTPNSTPWNGTPAICGQSLGSIVPSSFSKASFRLTFHDSRPKEETQFCTNQVSLASLVALLTLCGDQLFTCLSVLSDCEQLNYTDCSFSFQSFFPYPSDCHMPLNTKHLVKKCYVSVYLDRWVGGQMVKWMDGWKIK